jgi:hypothetical protein
MATSHHDRKRFNGWENYPCNLFTSVFDTDANQCKHMLREDAQRLFIPPNEACELGSRGFVFVKGALYVSV